MGYFRYTYQGRPDVDPSAILHSVIIQYLPAKIVQLSTLSQSYFIKPMVKPSQILHHILNLTVSPTTPQDKILK